MQSANERVQTALARAGLEITITEVSASTRTAEEAARAVGVAVDRIVKSLVFLAGSEPILLLVSGAHQVDLALVGAALARPVERAPVEVVRAATGFAIGGVAPVGLAEALPIFYDPILRSFETVWAAAGTPRSLFAIRPDDLIRVTGALPLNVSR